MALSVDETYIALADAKLFLTERGYSDWESIADADGEANLRKAADWIDRNFNFFGEKTDLSQRLEWPRRYVPVPNGYRRQYLDQDTIPHEVEEAQCLVAELYRTGNLSLTGGVSQSNQIVKKEEVAGIKVEYATELQLTVGEVTDAVYRLLDKYALARNTLLRG